MVASEGLEAIPIRTSRSPARCGRHMDKKTLFAAWLKLVTASSLSVFTRTGKKGPS
jgi:hypothetical protein